jgi:hypothetical protein
MEIYGLDTDFTVMSIFEDETYKIRELLHVGA